MRKSILAAVLIAVAIPAAPVLADPPSWAPAHGRRAHDAARNDSQLYDSRGRYRQPHALSRDDSVWRGNDGRYYCRRSNGTTGLIIGAAAGALLGRSIDTRGDRALGTLLGGAGGALLGREIDRGGVRCQ